MELVSIPFIGRFFRNSYVFPGKVSETWSFSNQSSFSFSLKLSEIPVAFLVRTRMNTDTRGAILTEIATKPIGARIRGCFLEIFFHFV